MKAKLFFITFILTFTLGITYGQDRVIMPAGNDHTSSYPSKAIQSLPTIIWKYPLPSKAISLTIANDCIFTGCYDYNKENETEKGYQFALDKKTGNPVWIKEINEQLSSPILYKGIAFYGSKKNKVIALRSDNGNLLWSYNDLRGPVCPPPVIVNNKIFFGTHSKEWCVLERQTGQVITKRYIDNGICCYPSYDQDKIYFVDWGGNLHAFTIENLKDSILYKSNKGAHIAPTLYQGHGYFFNDAGILHAINIESGKLIWTFQADGQIWGTPSINNDICMFVSDKSHLYALDIQTGELIWDMIKPGSINSTPAIAQNIVYVAMADNHLYALDQNSGEEIWKIKMEEALGGSLWIDNEVIYLTSGNNIVALAEKK